MSIQHAQKSVSLFFLGAATLFCFISACNSSKGTASEPAPTNQATVETSHSQPKPPVASTPEMDAKLLLADRLDGTEDKVVSLCSGCSLHMDGKGEYALTVGDYQMHFCSDFCLNKFADQPKESILALDVSEAP